jgi:hypothetical protein
MTMFFLAGLPRSGSTLLAAILNQNPMVHVTATSNLDGLMGSLVAAWESSPRNVEHRDADLDSMLRAIVEVKQSAVGKPFVIDKSRAWANPTIMSTMGRVLGEPPKIIATVRDVVDCAASFVRVAKPDNVREFLRTSPLIGHLKQSYITLHEGLKAAPENIHLVEYEALIRDPQKVLAGIYAFLGLEDFIHDTDHVDGSTVKENDTDAWGVPGLHDIRPKIEKSVVPDAAVVLDGLFDEFDQPAFWRGVTERAPKKLDLQLAASLRGDFEESSRLCREIEEEEPYNDRAAFNRGWYLLREGKLREGHLLLDRGRYASVFGNQKPPTPTEIWDGSRDQVVLLNLEGGFGDQINGLRWVREIMHRGSRCIVACSAELAPLVSKHTHAEAVIASEAAGHVYHTAWMPSMSGPSVLGVEYDSLDGSAFIRTHVVPRGPRKVIGLRWQGNPQFEHEQHRIFDPALMFEAVKGIDADFISLQRDLGAEKCPPWVKQVDLSTWEKTQQAIAGCDLVVSSCTSVAHLAAAMGIQTKIIVPVLPYYLWALPQDTTPWYNSVQLFRQTAPGTWKEPFAMLRQDLSAGSPRWAPHDNYSI